MGEPITWRNVLAPSLAEASRPLDMAGHYMNNAFDKLQNILQQREQTDINNINAIRANNTQKFLDQLAAFRTPEQLAAAQASGAIDTMRNQFGGLIDRAAVRGAEDARLTTLRDQTLKGQEFADKQQQLKDRPIVDNILSTLYKGDGKKATELLDANPHLLGHADVQKKVADYMATLDQRGRDATRFTWDKENHQWQMDKNEYEKTQRPLHERQLRASINASETSTAANAYGLERLKQADADAIEAQRLKEQLRGNMYSEGVLGDQHMADLRTLMKDNNIGGNDKESDAVDKRAYIVKAITKAMKNGVDIEYRDINGKKVQTNIKDIPLAAVKAAILGSNDNWYSFNEGWAGNFEKNLKETLARTTAVEKDGKKGLVSTPEADYMVFAEALRKAAELRAQNQGSGKRR